MPQILVGRHIVTGQGYRWSDLPMAWGRRRGWFDNPGWGFGDGNMRHRARVTVLRCVRRLLGGLSRLSRLFWLLVLVLVLVLVLLGLLLLLFACGSACLRMLSQQCLCNVESVVPILHYHIFIFIRIVIHSVEFHSQFLVIIIIIISIGISSRKELVDMSLLFFQFFFI